MEAEHGIAIVGILGTDVKNRQTRSSIDGWQKDGLTTGITGSLHDGIAILSKLFTIQMTMGIYVIEN